MVGFFEHFVLLCLVALDSSSVEPSRLFFAVVADAGGGVGQSPRHPGVDRRQFFGLFGSGDISRLDIAVCLGFVFVSFQENMSRQPKIAASPKIERRYGLQLTPQPRSG